MAPSFDALIERQIRQAQLQGKLDNLSGAGKPLDKHSGLQTSVASVGHAMMASAGVKPRQFTLKERLDKAREELKKTSDPAEKKALMTKVSLLELEYNVEREAYRNFLK
ncbi:DnaJ family domain-containing protein [Shimia sp. Alg240-R146]|uniref:DnaJ family domain-containing protein n=1 Tax=Shimia sp. Alg240-R146 TaxID=2993449 RepID=UPI0022DED4F4|nr:DnaJ family domain-containing protein [Shimia sp. Alg240-R146]